MIGGPVGWPIGGAVSSEAEVYAQAVAASVGATVGFAPFVVGKRVDAVADAAVSFGKAAAFRVAAVVQVVPRTAKALPRLITAGVEATAGVLKQVGKPLATVVEALAHPIITGIAYLKVIAVAVSASVQLGPFAVGKHVAATVAPAVSVMRAAAVRLFVTRAAMSVALAKQAGKRLSAPVAASVAMSLIKAWTLTISAAVNTSVTIRKGVSLALSALAAPVVTITRQTAIMFSVMLSPVVGLATQIYRFFRPRSMKTGLSAGRARGRIDAGHASSTVDD